MIHCAGGLHLPTEKTAANSLLDGIKNSDLVTYFDFLCMFPSSFFPPWKDDVWETDQPGERAMPIMSHEKTADACTTYSTS